MSAKTHRYTIPVVLQDLPPAEALHQAFDNLQHLNDVITDVFTRLTNRISNERAKVASVSNRVTSCVGKVVKISENPNKVTTIFSAAKFPAPKVLPDFSRAFDEGDDHPLSDARRTPYQITTKQRKVEPQAVDTTDLFTGLGKARASRQDPDRERLADENNQEGLGRLPSYLPSASSILLFNSDENPYKKYVTINNLEGKAGEDRQAVSTELMAAPRSLLEGTALPTFGQVAFDYKPDLGQVPTFALPQNLPLGRLADISFGVPESATQRIAPSVNALPSLPTAESFKTSMPSAERRTAPAGSTASTTVVLSSAPPPPPPANYVAPPPAPSNIPEPPAFSGAPPPPAPPMDAPPMDAPPAPSMDDAPATPSTPAASSGGGGGRGDLLAAIRDRKNIKLRKAATAVIERKPKKEAKASGGGGGDMMSALRERLARRATVMSGKIDKEIKVESATPRERGQTAMTFNLPKLGAKPSGGGEEGDEEPEVKRPAPGSRVERGKLGTRGEAKRVSIAEEDGDNDGGDGDEEGSGGAPAPSLGGRPRPKMSDTVMAAYAAAHRAKQSAAGDDDGW